jgi:thymidylate synthase (FAD)
MRNEIHIPVLDCGYVKLVEHWGGGIAGVSEAGIIEAARQSTQGSFRGWDVWVCNDCGQQFDGKVGHSTPNGACQIKSGWSNDRKLLAHLFNERPMHSTPFEFAGMTLEVKAPILVIREWFRHRTFSYNEMSARYAPLPDENYMPTVDRLFATSKSNKQAGVLKGAEELDANTAEFWRGAVKRLYDHAEEFYQWGLKRGVPKELARVVLPVGRYSQFRASGNLLNWLKFCGLRAHPKAQWEIQQYAYRIEDIMQEVFPETYKLYRARRDAEENKA